MKKLIISLFIFGLMGNSFAEDKPPNPPSQAQKDEQKREPPVIVHKPGKELAKKIREKLGLDHPRGLP